MRNNVSHTRCVTKGQALHTHTHTHTHGAHTPVGVAVRVLMTIKSKKYFAIHKSQSAHIRTVGTARKTTRNNIFLAPLLILLFSHKFAAGSKFLLLLVVVAGCSVCPLLHFNGNFLLLSRCSRCAANMTISQRNN